MQPLPLLVDTSTTATTTTTEEPLHIISLPNNPPSSSTTTSEPSAPPPPPLSGKNPIFPTNSRPTFTPEATTGLLIPPASSPSPQFETHHHHRTPPHETMAAPPNAPAEALKSAAERLGRYLHRLPLLTRAVGVGIVGVYLLDVMGAPVAAGFRLDPKVMGLDQMHRLNTYPLVHHGLLHALVNLIALLPLLERFEREVGTLKSVLLIAGPLVTFPGILYTLLELFIFHGTTAVEGASALVFTFLAMEAVKTYAFQPYYTIAGNEIPSWTTPGIWMVVATLLVPGSSFVGHLCGLVVGYAYAWRYMRILEPSEWILKKVEEKLGFVLLRLPWYVCLEKRTEMNYFEMLPMAAAPPAAAHLGGPGRTLGV